MIVLLDTHVFLWLLSGDSRLTQDQRDVLNTEDHQNLLSIASVWEMAVKTATGKLKIALPFNDFIRKHTTQNHIALFPISFDHVSEVAVLPLHHRDPFDRLLAAQCLLENISIVSHDDAFDLYGVKRIK